MGAEVSLILPRVYLSELPNDKLLSELGITHTISVIEQSFIPKLESIPNDHWLRLDIADRPNEDLLKHLEETTEFIRRALSESPENKVLVHCYMGISRSATVVCAYVIATAEPSMTVSEAIAFVQSKRPAVCPNPGFRTQLESYATRFAGRRAADEGSSGIPASQIRAGNLDTTIEEGNSSQAEPEEYWLF